MALWSRQIRAMMSKLRPAQSIARAEFCTIRHKTMASPCAQLTATSTQLADRSFTCPSVGFKLLGANLWSSAEIIKRVAVGHLLNGSERTTLQRTVLDCVKLASLSMLFLIPFAPTLLPMIPHKFPGMIPSTFFEAQDCLVSLAVRQRRLAEAWHEQIKDVQISDLVKGTEFPKAEEIMAFQEQQARSFRLDSMSKPQLHSLAKLLGLKPMKVTSVLKWRLRRYMRRIRREDRNHVWDGFDRLSKLELAKACKNRAIPFHGLTKTDMQAHLGQWAQLSSQMGISTCLLLWIQSSFNLELGDPGAHVQQKDAKSKRLSASLNSVLSLQSDTTHRQHQRNKQQRHEVMTVRNRRSLEIATTRFCNKSSLEKEKTMTVDEMQAQIDDIINSLLEKSGT